MGELRPLSRLQRVMAEASAALSLADARAGALHTVRALIVVVAGASSALDPAAPRPRGLKDVSDSTGSSGANTPALTPRAAMGSASVAGGIAAEPLAALQVALRAFETALRAYQDALQSPALQDADAVCQDATKALRDDCQRAAAETAQVA